MMTLSISCFSYAETQTGSVEASADLKPLSGVRVSMQRMLKSGEGRYYYKNRRYISHKQNGYSGKIDVV